MQNHTAHTVTAVEGAKMLSVSEAFKRGYDDYTKGRTFDYDIASKTEAIYYERGRAFAIWNKVNAMPRATWRNKVAAKTVTERIVRAIGGKYVI